MKENCKVSYDALLIRGEEEPYGGFGVSQGEEVVVLPLIFHLHLHLGNLLSAFCESICLFVLQEG